MAWVGRSVPRLDGRAKVTGRAVYASDLRFPGMLQGRILRSPYPHARIVALDPRPALAVPGVVAVLTGEDVAGLGLYGHSLRDRPVLALGRARFAGEPVAAVAAEDAAAAEEALARIAVTYEPLPAATDIEAALAPDAPLVHAGGYGEGEFDDLSDLGAGAVARAANVCSRHRVEHGDVDALFARADHLREDVYTFPAVYHYAMEPHTAVARFSGGRLEVASSCQHQFIVRAELAELFGLPLDRVRVHSVLVGGGFGSKSYTKIEPLVAALATRCSGRPVHVALDVEEAMLTGRRHGAKIVVRTAADGDGRLLARAATVLLDTGAYADNGPRVARAAAGRMIGPYRWAAYRVESLAVYTHTGPAGSFRAIGGPQSVWAGESQIDELARDMGLDPLDLRRRNLVGRGQRPQSGRKPMEADLPADLERLAAGAGPDAGIAVATSDAGAGPVATALVRLHGDGSVTLLAAGTEMGQGAQTVLAQIVAEELAVPLSRVRCLTPDTDGTPFNRSTGASRTTTVVGTAVLEAARDAARQRDAAGGVDPAGPEIVGRGLCGPFHEGGRLATSPVFWEVGMARARVDVDDETGEVRLRELVSLADVGRAINPALAEGQDEGAAVMGIGHTLMEAIAFEDGQIGNGSLVDYPVPRFGDLPAAFSALLVEDGDGPGPYGGKGVGEAGIMAVAPAVAAALWRRAGVRLRDLPLTPERVWRALRRGDAPAAPPSGGGAAQPPI